MSTPNSTPTHKLAYSIREACEATSLGRSTLYKWIDQKKLETVRIGGRRLIKAESLQKFLSREI